DLYLAYVFVACYCDILLLHPFPTRRSSDLTLGPALGGCRMWPYDSEEEALVDALRLARGMTYKNAAMGLNFGGGKAVILADPRRSEEHTSELQSRENLVCRLLLEKKKHRR